MEYNKPRTGEKKKRWSVKYKKSINCSNPKGFSQINYCKRKKRGGDYKNESFMNLFLESVVDEQVEESISKKIGTAALAAALATMSPNHTQKPKSIDTEYKSDRSIKNIRSQYDEIVDIILDQIEGGYYNKGQVKDTRYKRSGETMYGIDRERFGKKNKDTEEFWDIIEKNKKEDKKSWVWNYKGGKDEEKLKEKAKDIMYDRFDLFFNKYLTPEAKKIVEKDYKLLFHFIYATWNGQGHFKNFSKIINKEVEEGNNDPEDLFNIAMSNRSNLGSTLLKRSADKIKYLTRNK